MNSSNKEESEAIVFEDLRKLFKLKSKENFEFYLENIYDDLCTKKENKKFLRFNYSLPYHISEKALLRISICNL